MGAISLFRVALSLSPQDMRKSPQCVALSPTHTHTHIHTHTRTQRHTDSMHLVHNRPRHGVFWVRVHVTQEAEVDLPVLFIVAAIQSQKNISQMFNVSRIKDVWYRPRIALAICAAFVGRGPTSSLEQAHAADDETK